jgi:sigma-54 dependent transcriptional regulator, acetoin dehydrogenase operon transcriptional activator AcoR
LLQPYSSHARLVYSVIRGTSPETSAPDYVKRSWLRCLDDYSLHPESNAQASVVSRQELLARRDQNAELVAFADVEMAQLYRQLADSGHSIILTDRDGVLLSYCGDPTFKEAASRAGLVPGAVWSERYGGTNGMGTCLLEQRPLIVHREQHFLVRNIGLTCCAAPIYDHRNKLIAVLDASGAWDRAQQHTLVLVNMSAQMIENRLFLHRFRDAFVLRFHSRPELVGTWSEGLIALDAAGAVLALDRNARFQLGCIQSGELINAPLEGVFDIALGSLFGRSRKQPFQPLPVHEARHGGRFFVVAQLPNTTQPAPGAPTAADEVQGLNALARAEREALLDELEREDGNISHVARNLRISRNAVYRKIYRLRIPWPIKERRH